VEVPQLSPARGIARQQPQALPRAVAELPVLGSVVQWHFGQHRAAQGVAATGASIGVTHREMAGGLSAKKNDKYRCVSSRHR